MSKIYCSIYNGLGNQLFSYALGMYLAKKHKKELIPDLTKLNLFNFLSRVGLKRVTRREYELHKIGFSDPINNFKSYEFVKRNKFIKGKRFMFADFRNSQMSLENVDPKQNIYVIGFGDFNFVKEILPEMKSLFSPGFELTKDISNTIKVINRHNSIAIHIRRTDYLDPKIGDFSIGICSDKYYKNAIRLINEQVENPFFIIFSDDTEYIQEHFDFEDSYIVGGNSGYEDLYLMSLCKHFILANSTFSFWAAMLNNNEKKSVCVPEFWYNEPLRMADFVPKEWSKVAIE